MARRKRIHGHRRKRSPLKMSIFGGVVGAAATGASIGAAIYGKNRTRAIIRTLGSISLTILYLGSKEKN